MSADKDTGTNDGESTYDRKQQAGKKKGSTYESFKDGKSQGIDYGVKDSVEDYKQEKFNKGEKHNLSIFDIKLDPLNKFFDKGSKRTRAYYTDRVLKGENLKKFRSLNTTEQEKQYQGYLDRRLSGETDAMGNVNPNFGKDRTDSVRTIKQVEEESKNEMKKETPKTTEEEEAAYKKRKGLVGSRSLFSTGGQRGFFN